jgi:hypothetical protein
MKPTPEADGRKAPIYGREGLPRACPIADVPAVVQHRAMFDWSDLLLLLPKRVFWVLFGVFLLLIAAAVIWAKLG